MRKQLYNHIKTLLTGMRDAQNRTVIKHVDLWNNQLATIEEERPFRCPAVFIEFQPIEWRELLRTNREAEVSINLHIVTDSRKKHYDVNTDGFELSETINSILHGTHCACSDSITMVTSYSDNDFDELMDNIDVYKCRIRT